MSTRKPYNVNAGYIASRKFGTSYIVIYNAEQASLDVGKKYAIVCETHNRLVGATSMPASREIMKNPDFCEKCFTSEYKYRIGTKVRFADGGVDPLKILGRQIRDDRPEYKVQSKSLNIFYVREWEIERYHKPIN
jgi:hypothetical protein